MDRNSKYKYTSMFNEEYKMITMAFPGSEKNPSDSIKYVHHRCAIKITMF